MIGLQSLASDFGFDFGIRIFTASSSAKGICSRRGAGMIRHIEVALLWLQDTLGQKVFKLYKIDGEKKRWQ
eukprot:676805-Prorocentrum_lima.AAC.1